MKNILDYKLFENFKDIKQDIMDICLDITDYNEFSVSVLNSYIAICKVHDPRYDGFSIDDEDELREVLFRIKDYLGGLYNGCSVLYVGESEREFIDLSEEGISDDRISNIVIYFKNEENISEGLKFVKQPKKKGAKTDIFNVNKNDIIIGQVKWSSRMRGYSFLPTPDCDPKIKEFVKELMRKRREDKEERWLALNTELENENQK